MLRPDVSDGALPRFEGWTTLEKLGEGGMCAVYRARPDAAGPERAIKVLTDKSAAAIRRFTDEARLLQRIGHPNVVRVHAIAELDRPPWLVMDLLAGRDLEQTMKVEGPMDPERAAVVFADLASALAAVHAAGVRHRDIKPANIRLGDDGVARLIDFGIARDAHTERVTRTGMVVGTASYLPPEIFVEEDANRVQDTEAADVYALGQTMCELLAGKPVHGGRERGTEASLLVRIMRDKLDRDFLDPRDFGVKVPDGLCQVVRHATMREPEGRLQHAADLEVELRDWLETRRSSASMAPLTRIDPSTLPSPQALEPSPAVPPAAPPTPRPAPGVSPAPGSQHGATPAPAESSGRVGAVATTAAVGAVGAVGIAGATLIALGIVICLVLVGVAAFRFAADSDAERLRTEVDRQSAELVRCRPSDEATELVLSLTVENHRTRSVTVSGDAGGRVGRCAERVLEQRRWSVAGPITVEVPVRFR